MPMQAQRRGGGTTTTPLLPGDGKGFLSAPRPGRFTPIEKAPGIHWMGRLVGPRIGTDLWRTDESLVHAGNRTTISRLPTSRPNYYTDWAIPAIRISVINCREEIICKLVHGNLVAALYCCNVLPEMSDYCLLHWRSFIRHKLHTL